MSAPGGGTWSFILVAAGSGSRMRRPGAADVPKQFRALAGMPVWEWSARVAERLYEGGRIDELVVVLPLSSMEQFVAPDFICPVKFVAGGAARTDSVKAGLSAANGDFVLVHDAARPFLTEDMCLALMGATNHERGAVPLLASVDSLKLVEGDAIRALDRNAIYRTQTPQAFPRAALLDVVTSGGNGATDEATLWLAAKRELIRVEGSAMNFKITTDYDWQVASALTAVMRETRTGFGFDVHELVPERSLILGGLTIQSPLGLLGHSDADIVSHAISDALLGAAGEGDIGTLFPADDETYRGADSTALLGRVLRLIREKGWRVAWLDVTLAAQVPRLGGELAKISDNLRDIFTQNGVEAKLSLKVKSGERTGSVGRAECMTCYAVATLERFDIGVSS